MEETTDQVLINSNAAKASILKKQVQFCTDKANELNMKLHTSGMTKLTSPEQLETLCTDFENQFWELYRAAYIRSLPGSDPRRVRLDFENYNSRRFKVLTNELAGGVRRETLLSAFDVLKKFTQFEGGLFVVKWQAVDD